MYPIPLSRILIVTFRNLVIFAFGHRRNLSENYLNNLCLILGGIRFCNANLQNIKPKLCFLLESSVL